MDTVLCAKGKGEKVSSPKQGQLSSQFDIYKQANLSVAGKFRNFSLSHSDDHSFPNSKFKLLAQDELHGFAAAPHGPRVIQNCSITQAGAIVKDHLMNRDRINTCTVKIRAEQLVKTI